MIPRVAKETGESGLTVARIQSGTALLRYGGLDIPQLEKTSPSGGPSLLPPVPWPPGKVLEVAGSFRKTSQTPAIWRLLQHQASGQGINCAFSCAFAFAIHHHAGISAIDLLRPREVKALVRHNYVLMPIALRMQTLPDAATVQKLHDHYITAMRDYLAEESDMATNVDYTDREAWGSIFDAMEAAIMGFRFCAFTMDRKAVHCDSCGQHFYTPHEDLQFPERPRHRYWQFHRDNARASMVPAGASLEDHLRQAFCGIRGEDICINCDAAGLIEHPTFLDRVPPVLVMMDGWFDNGQDSKGKKRRARHYPGSFGIIQVPMYEGKRLVRTAWTLSGVIRWVNRDHFVYDYKDQGFRTWDCLSESSGFLEYPEQEEDVCGIILHRNHFYQAG